MIMKYCYKRKFSLCRVN